MTIYSDKDLYAALLEAIGEGDCLNCVKHAYDTGVCYSRILRMIKLGVELGILTYKDGFSFSVERERLIPERLAGMPIEEAVQALDGVGVEMMNHVFDSDGILKKELLDFGRSFQKLRNERKLDQLVACGFVKIRADRVYATVTREAMKNIKRLWGGGSK